MWVAMSVRSSRNLPVPGPPFGVSAAGAALPPDRIPREAMAAEWTPAQQLPKGWGLWNHPAYKTVRRSAVRLPENCLALY